MPITCCLTLHAHTGPVNYLLFGAQSAHQDIAPTSSTARVELPGVDCANASCAFFACPPRRAALPGVDARGHALGLIGDGARHAAHAREPKKAGRDRDRGGSDGPWAGIDDPVEGGWRVPVLSARLQPARRDHEAVHLRHLPCSQPRPLPRTVGRAACTAAWPHMPLATQWQCSHPAVQKATRLGRAAPWIARVAWLLKRGCGGAPVPPENRRFHRVRPSRRRCCTAVHTWSSPGS